MLPRNPIAYAGLLGVILLSACSPVHRPSWTSAEDNIAFAVSAICAPYVLDSADEASLPTHKSLVHDDGWNEGAFQRLGARPVRVGFAGFIHVAVGVIGGHRQCEITSRQADAQALRTSALAALKTRSEAFAPTASRYLPGRFATEDMLCASAQSAHPGGFVLLSAAKPEGRQSTSVLLTMSDEGARMPACDRNNVPMNYRTLMAAR